jgi:hypothetical protein
MGTGQVGVPWIVANASTIAEESTGECAGLVVRKLSFNLFQKYLVTHFKKLWERKQLLWPSRTGKVEWVLM